MIFENAFLRLTVAGLTATAGAPECYRIQSIELKTANGWNLLLQGIEGHEFSTSLGGADARRFEATPLPGGGWRLELAVEGAEWDAEETITLEGGKPYLRRQQIYRFHKDLEGAIHPGWHLQDHAGLRYTYPLFAHEKPLAGLPAIRADVTFALPFPFHVWHAGEWVAFYGVDRTRSGGTLDFQPGSTEQPATVRVYLPEATPPQRTTFAEQWYKPTPRPTVMPIKAGAEIKLVEIIGAKCLKPGQEPLLEAEREAAELLLTPRPMPDLKRVAAGIADFYRKCGLWNPNALGEGRGWFYHMWVCTHEGTPRLTGSGAGSFDLGWGEGTAAEAILGLTRYWRRTGQSDVLAYVDEMSRNMHLFQHGEGPNAPYFDRTFDGKRFHDFNGDRRFWTQSMGHTASQLIQCYQENPNYPNPSARQEWLRVATSIAGFLAEKQKANGDLPDIMDEAGNEISLRGKKRISARVVVAGLWTRLSQITGNKDYLDRALRLARFVQPEIEDYSFYNQMIDAITAPFDLMDGEAAYYVLEGLVPLYEATRAPWLLSLCQKAAAFGVSWTYFFDVPLAYKGIARGGQVCRMPDLPLLYPIGPAKAMDSFLRLAKLTGDDFYRRMAEEMIVFIGHYQIEAPSKPWHGGMVHAIDQRSGQFWGPDKQGQVDCGMSTGNSLAAIERWLSAR